MGALADPGDKRVLAGEDVLPSPIDRKKEEEGGDRLEGISVPGEVGGESSRSIISGLEDEVVALIADAGSEPVVIDSGTLSGVFAPVCSIPFRIRAKSGSDKENDMVGRFGADNLGVEEEACGTGIGSDISSRRGAEEEAAAECDRVRG